MLRRQGLQNAFLSLLAKPFTCRIQLKLVILHPDDHLNYTETAGMGCIEWLMVGYGYGDAEINWWWDVDMGTVTVLAAVLLPCHPPQPQEHKCILVPGDGQKGK